jgi:superfamily II DNA or RNA helicase
MYLARLGDNKLAELKEGASSSKLSLSLLSRLKKGEFHIVYFLDRSKKTIRYEAFDRDGKYLSFSIDSGKNFAYCPLFPLQGKEEGMALAYFLALKESKLGDEKLKDIYGDDYAFLLDDARLSYEEAQELSKARHELACFRLSLPLLLPSPPKKKPAALFVSFEKGSNGGFDISFFVKDGLAKKRISSPSLLLNAYLERKRLSFLFGELDFKDPHPYGPFLEKCLARATNRNGVEDHLRIQECDLPDLLACLLGKEISFLGHPILIESITEAKVVSKEGKLALSPCLKLGGEAYFGDSLGFYFLKDEGEGTLLRFQSKEELAYFRFVLSHPSFPYGLLGEDLRNAFLPYMKEENALEGIFYYLSLTTNGTISCRTSYILKGEEVDEERFACSGAARKRARDCFLSCLSLLCLKENGAVEKEDDIVSFLSGDILSLNKYCALYVDEALQKARITPIKRIRFSLSRQGDWFALDASSDFYSNEELAKLALSYKKKKRYVIVGGNYVDLSILDGTKEGELLLELGEESSSRVSLPLALRLCNLGEETLRLDEQLKEILGEVINYKKASLKDLDPSLSKLLRPYQADGVRWMKSLSKHGLGGILGDEMGLGKTLETIAFLSLSKSSLPSLIVAPKSLLYNWKEEFSRFDPSREVVVLSSLAKNRLEMIKNIKRNGKVYIVSYDSLRNDIELYKGKKFACLILDEAQYISNAAAKKSEAVKEISASCRFALTGTPIQNSLLDLWSIFDFLMPGYLPDFPKFKAEYGVNEFSSKEQKKRLQTKITPFLLKRTKDEVCLDLPKKEESNVYLSLGEEQRKAYEAYLALARGELKLGEGNRIAILAAITRLRQICVSPELFVEGNNESVKIDYLLSSLDELLSSGHKALVFSSFTKALEIVSAKLKEKGIEHGFLYGASSAEERLAMASRFNEDPLDSVMLVSLKAGGTGLNLIGADTVFLLDPWWNLSAEEQAFARAHRIGQDKNVSIFRLVAEQTVEEKVLLLQKKKRELTSILGGVSSSNIGKDDLDFLLS